jgi:hypothetical protein
LPFFSENRKTRLMAETATKIDVCEICGVGVRPDSAFCYNCGGNVKADEPAATESPVANAGDEMEIAVHESNGNVAAEDAPVRIKNRDRKRNVRSRAVSERKPMKMSWEPRTGNSLSFIVGSIVIVVLALTLFIAAYYIK